MAWYTGNNLRGRTSLFRKTAGNAPPEEIAEGISNLQIEYLVPGSANYVASTGVGANWGNINAIRIAFTAQSAERVAVGGQRLSRDIVYYAALRNRNQ